ncbi:hypothetical protein VTK73DRAFT_2016 [Phialemonium thermophilum]|uniref:DUF218 domain-containing protein n=1 Tax=Phialemonium thermophilum TaxID=223376 RepID=A0ABR3VSP7_9PEZI
MATQNQPVEALSSTIITAESSKSGLAATTTTTTVVGTTDAAAATSAPGPTTAPTTTTTTTPPSAEEIDRAATLVYNYHRMSLPLRPADAIFVLCSLDLRVAERAADLFHQGYGSYLIISGGTGVLTANVFGGRSEAEVFADVARARGVPDDCIRTETRSTNTGENVRFTHALLRGAWNLPHLRSFVLVQKPYMERRTFATFVKQWPEPDVQFSVASPLLEFADYPDADNPRDLVINVMVGDLVRIREYPARGFQIPQDIPDEVWQAGQRLIAAGYDRHLP